MAVSGKTRLVGSSRQIRAVRTRLHDLAAVPWPVRIEGPSGCGKNLAARFLHNRSPRCEGPFVACNVGAIPQGLEVAEFQGHTRGAFTSAVDGRAGVFEAAHGGTLFLDEIGTASPTVQQALLQLLEDGTFRRIGDHRDTKVDVRVVFATNADLSAGVARGEFREDLFHRLGRLVVEIPSLASRKEDLPELAFDIMMRKAREIDRDVPDLTDHDMGMLMEYDWPGNVRELEHVLEYFLVFGSIPPITPRASRGCAGWRERMYDALRLHDGNKTAAARELGVSRNTLYKELRKQAG